MAQDTALQVIELQQLPIIVERLHSVKADIERRTCRSHLADLHRRNL